MEKNLKLYRHQIEGVEFLKKNNFIGALAWSIGAGKSIGGFSSFLEARKDNPALKLLVVAPLSLLSTCWEHDLARFTTLKICNLHKGKWFDADAYLVNIEFTRSEKKFMKIVAWAKSTPVFCVVDESSMIKSPTAMQTKRMLMLSTYFKHRVIMSGTMICNSELDLYCQIQFLKPGYLGTSFYQFRNLHFYLQRGKQIVQGKGFGGSEFLKKGFKYIINPAKKAELMKKVSTLCHCATLAECLDLPEIIEETRTYELHPDQRKAYNSMKHYLIAEISEHEITAQNALVKMGKLRQLCSGFCIGEDAKVSRGPYNPKLALLEEVLNEIPQEEQVIIWAVYQYENRQIQAFLQGRGQTFETAYGDTKDLPGSIQRFKEKKSRFLIASQQSISHGQTLTNAHIQIYYSTDYSAERFIQSKGRVMRLSQESDKVVYIYLQGIDTIEEDIYRVLAGKIDVAEAVRRFVSQNKEAA